MKSLRPYNIRKYVDAVFLLTFIYMLSCSQNPHRATENIVLVTFADVDEALFEDVRSGHFSTMDSEMITLFDTVFSLNASSEDISPFQIVLPTGVELIFKAWFYDDSSRPLYRVFESRVFADHLPEDFMLQPSQTGYGSGTDVKILRDEPPWDSYGLDSTLVEIGLTTGNSVNQYSIYSSSDLASIGFTPGNDILIISNDQPQVFYDNLSANLNIITEFAAEGGIVFWETCDLAWNYGSYADAGIDSFPGGIRHNTSYDPINTVSDPDFYLVSGLGETLTGGYASNKRFSNIPDSAIVYTIDTGGFPTLIGLKFGSGFIYYSGQPLEYNFDRRDDYNIGFLLPRVISFLLGMAWEEPSLHFPGRVTHFRLDNCQNKSDQPA
jgi:hypothetical protein